MLQSVHIKTISNNDDFEFINMKRVKIFFSKTELQKMFYVKQLKSYFYFSRRFLAQIFFSWQGTIFGSVRKDILLIKKFVC